MSAYRIDFSPKPTFTLGILSAAALLSCLSLGVVTYVFIGGSSRDERPPAYEVQKANVTGNPEPDEFFIQDGDTTYVSIDGRPTGNRLPD
ncbi:hypothetical protein ACFLQN_00950 [Candidatus Aenigmatarchaeota archaeon]